MSHYSSISNGFERVFWHAKVYMTSSKPRERTHEASTDNMANEDCLLSVICDLLKVLIIFCLLTLLSSLAEISGQFSIIQNAINTSG